MPEILFQSSTAVRSSVVCTESCSHPDFLRSSRSYMVCREFYSMLGDLYCARILSPEFTYCARISIMCPEFYTVPEFL